VGEAWLGNEPAGRTRGGKEREVRAHDVVGDWMSRRQADGPERPVVLRGTAGVRARIVLQR